jgi:hypothetical protein
VVQTAEQFDQPHDHQRRLDHIRDRRGIPHLRAGQGPWDDAIRCWYCRWPTHQARDCPHPHHKCTNARLGYCLVPRRHQHYQRVDISLYDDCPYHGRRIGEEHHRVHYVMTRGDQMDAGECLFEDNMDGEA